MRDLIKVVDVAALGHPVLRVRFSNGREGVRNFRDMLAEGGAMVEPLNDPALFSRVFLHCGTLAWPNGFDLDAIALHDEMLEAGALGEPIAA